MKIFSLIFVALMLCACSTVRPPSAAAFMDSYGKILAGNLSLAIYAGDLDNGGRVNIDEEKFDKHEESRFLGNFNLFMNQGYFTFGTGIQNFNPFVQTGFVSPYIGFTSWSNFDIFFEHRLSDDDELEGGIMLIEQIPIGKILKLGLTEHVGRNGREIFNCHEDWLYGECSLDPSKIYLEVGGGLYVMVDFTYVKTAIEFRYGRDIDNDANRFALMFDVFNGFTNEHVEKFKAWRHSKSVNKSRRKETFIYSGPYAPQDTTRKKSVYR